MGMRMNAETERRVCLERGNNLPLRSQPNEQSKLERKLLRYLIDHPDARDTLEGIAKWWLLEQEIREEKARVQEALAELVAKRIGC